MAGGHHHHHRDRKREKREKKVLRKRIQVDDLFGKDEGYDEECIEDKLKREKDEMLAVIMEKSLFIECLKGDKEKLKRELNEKETQLKTFQSKYSKLLWETSRTRNQRWLVLNQTSNKKQNEQRKKASATWQQVREEAEQKE